MTIQSSLNKLVADLNVLFVKLHHYHWYVKGPQFFQLHEKFEDVYNDVNKLYDAFAERLIAIGGSPASSLEAYVTLTGLKEIKQPLNAFKMVQSLIDDLRYMTASLKALLTLAQEEKDEVTADMAIGVIRDFDNLVWMFEATLEV
jgi:starvation-inducible DNA-binding protein